MKTSKSTRKPALDQSDLNTVRPVSILIKWHIITPVNTYVVMDSYYKLRFRRIQQWDTLQGLLTMLCSTFLYEIFGNFFEQFFCRKEQWR